MKVAIFGAAGGTGRHLTEQSLEAGHDVTAFVGETDSLPLEHPRLTIMQGDVTEPRRVEQAVAGQQAVLGALVTARSSVPNIVSRGVRHIVSAMQSHGVQRLVTLTGAGVSEPGDPPSMGGSLALLLFRLLSPRVIEDARRHVGVVRESNLEWVIVRAPRLIAGPVTGRYRTGRLSLGVGSRISHADVAHFMLRQLTDSTYLRQLPFISY